MGIKVYSSVLIGLGDIGLNYDLDKDQESYIQTHARAFYLNPGFDLLGGVDIDANACDIFTKKYNIRSFTKIEDALIELKPDLIILAIPTHLHLVTIKKIEKYHKPLAILCEKPMGDNLVQGYEIVNICKKLGVSLYVNYFRTCLPGSKEVKKLIDNSLIKSPMKCVVWYSKGLMHNGSHFVNLMHYWFGACLDLNIIEKGREFKNFGFEPYAILKYEGCEVSFIPVWEEFYSHYTIEIISSNGRLYWGGKTLEWTQIQRSKSQHGHSYLSDKSENMVIGADKYQMYVADELYSAMGGKVSSICTDEKALETLNTIDRILTIAHNKI
tara:strand:+ start:429 stop:1409 length:981 start_codon:yes stop_codon:yes gene_type:complete